MARDIEFIENLLSDGNARTLAEIDAAVVAAGFGSKTSNSLELLIESIPDSVPLPGDRWVRSACAFSGRYFTHYLSAKEQASDILLSEPDLSVFEGACLGEGVTFQGEPVDLLDSTFDADLFYEAGLSPAEETFALQLPLGALEHLVADSLIVLSVERDGSLTIAPLEVVVDSDPEVISKALLAELTKYESEAPIETEQLLLSACCANPDLFRTPAKPVSEILMQAGLTARESYVLFNDFDFVAWDQANAIRWLESEHGLDESAALAVISLIQLVDSFAQQLNEMEDSSEFAAMLDSVATTTSNDETVLALRRLSDPRSARALLSQVMDFDESSPLPLLLAVRSWRQCAPRNALAALGWLEGKALERLGNTDAAEAVYKSAESADSSWSPVLMELARYASDRGNAVRAVSLLERAGTPSDDDQLNIMKRFAAASEVSDRNAPCWCGSGRKVKVCHRSAPPLPMEVRAAWLHHKAVIYLHGGPYLGELFDVARERSHYWPGMEGYLRGLGDPLVHDSMLCEGGVFAEFLLDRGHLLPEDEFELAQRWVEIERSVFDVEEVVLNQGLSLRDIRSGERTWVSEQMATHSAKPGMLIVTRLLPCGKEWQMFGSLELVSLMQRTSMIELFDGDPEPAEVVAALSAHYAPPVLQTTTGELLVLCRAEVKVKELKKFKKVLAERYEFSDDSWVRAIDDTVHAILQIVAGVVSIETMSEERMETELDWISELPMFVKIISEEATALEDLLLEESTAFEDLLLETDPELAQVLAEAMAKYEKDWLDESIPALAGVTPRNAAADPTRRSDLIALLKSFPIVEGGMSAQRLAEALDLDEYN